MGNIEKFDSMAEHYDTPERAETARIIANAIRARITYGERKRAIDYGCGTGLVGLELLDAFASITFIDAAPAMLDQIRSKTAHIPGVATLCLDFEQRPPEISADYIILAQVLLHVQNIEPFLRALLAALNPGGRLLIVDFDKNTAVDSELVHSGFDQGVLRDLLVDIGFSFVHSETFYRAAGLFMGLEASLFLMEVCG